MITMTFVPRGRNARARQAVQTLEFPVLACFFHLLLPPPPNPLSSSLFSFYFVVFIFRLRLCIYHLPRYHIYSSSPLSHFLSLISFPFLLNYVTLRVNRRLIGFYTWTSKPIKLSAYFRLVFV